MRHNTIVTAGLFIFLAALAVPAAEIYPPKGDPIKGDVLSVSDKEVVYAQGDKKITKSIKEVLKIDYRDAGKVSPLTTYSIIELTDGTQLHASKWLLKKKELEATLLAGPTVKLPVAVVANVLNEGQNENYRRDWRTRVFNMRNREALVIRRELKDDKGGPLLTKDGKKQYTISSLEATLGEGSDDGTKITFAVTILDKVETRQRDLAALQGVIFKHILDTKAPPATCKLLDMTQDVVMVSSIEPREGGGVAVTTPAGAQIVFNKDQLARIDYTKGKLDYLSDLEPKIVARSNLDETTDPDQWHVYKDTNLNKATMSVGGASYAKGLALKPFAQLTFDLKGDYREFEAVAGIDDSIRAAGAVVLLVEGDDKELSKITISSSDKKQSRNVVLNIKDVQKLKITVMAENDFDTAVHLNLADAKVRKE